MMDGTYMSSIHTPYNFQTNYQIVRTPLIPISQATLYRNMSHEIYREQQQGGNCRKHAVNAYLSYRNHPILTMPQWQSHMNEFAKQWSHTGLDPTSWDFFGPAQENIITHICHTLTNVWSRVVPYSHIQKYISTHDIDMADEHFIFVFSASHIWGVRYHKGSWWLVDSMRPISQISDIKQYMISLGRIHGLVIPRHPRNAIRDIIEYIPPHDPSHDMPRDNRDEIESRYSLSTRVLQFIPPPSQDISHIVPTILKQYHYIRKQYDDDRGDAIVSCISHEIELCQNLRAFVKKLLECLVI